MKKPKIKKVMVELENGKVIEFNRQVILVAEDDMTETEKKLHDEQAKMCCVAECSTSFMASAANAVLGMLADNAPGLDSAVMMKHVDEKHDILSMLAEALG